MRLTLRTLLAYLDQTLEPDDAAILKAKIDGSPRAMTLVSRIQSSMDHAGLGAASPDAVGPLDNANLMSEYLDSMLSVEQVAELEQLCQESDTALAEAAACHQILALALGQPARVSDSLRERIYSLPTSDALKKMESETQRAPDSSPVRPADSTETVRYSSLEIPPASPQELEPDIAPTVAATIGIPDAGTGSASTGFAGTAGLPGMPGGAQGSTNIQPVGPYDSGVSDAATRLRNTPGVGAVESESAAVVQATRKALLESDGYGGMIRPSRITPWLVSLGIAAAFAFALASIFKPWLDQRAANRMMVDAGGLETATPGSQRDPVDPMTPERRLPQKPEIVDSAIKMEQDSSPVESAAEASGAVEAAGAAGTDTPADVDVANPVATMTESVGVPENVASTEAMRSAEKTDMPESGAAAEPIPPVQSSVSDLADMTIPGADPVPDDGDRPDGDGIADADANMAPDDAGPQPDPDAVVIAQLMEPDSLVLVRVQDRWRRLRFADEDPAVASDDSVPAVAADQSIIVPGFFRPIFGSAAGLEWTLVGPARMAATVAGSGGDPSSAGVRTRLDEGRLLLASTQDRVLTQLQLGPRKIQVTLPDAQTVLAIEMAYLRSPGSAPDRPEFHEPIYGLVVVQGTANIAPASGGAAFQPVSLTAGQRWQAAGENPPTVATVDSLPIWIDPPGRLDPVTQSARENLGKIVREGQAIEQSLREAMSFRRSEVGALAAETLLMLGRADVYFGSDGIFRRPGQRMYWNRHFQSFQRQIAISPETADEVRRAIMRAELADGDVLFQLLVGFSPDELAAGGDAKLVQWLDSPSMSVRVLAMENLRMIAGEANWDALGYTADLESATRRADSIRKWQAKLRRGDIRYPGG